jgi:gamma-glutamyltranspeptidase/glutathione hydrolase
MVVVQEPLAADVGLAVLKEGGNAVDAAIAIGFALAVTHPSAGNIGGGGFMLVRMADGKSTFLDFRESAPGKASHDMYLDADGNPTRDSILGWRASGVPGSLAGFEYAYKKFATKTWAQLLTPAVKLAGDGFTVDSSFASSLGASKENPLQADPESRRIFLRDGNPYKAGEIFKQPELAATLDRVAKFGAKEFYEGETAKRFADAMAANHGIITQDDLKNYKVIERTPLEGNYKGFHILTAPPPSAGGVGLLQILGILQGTKYEAGGANSPTAVHYEAEAMRLFYADRSEYIGDPDFYNVPVSALLDPKYLAKRRKMIDTAKATPSDLVEPGLPRSVSASLSWQESSETTHYNVVDDKGNAVAVTYTLNGWFGNGITVPGLGFLLNNEMDDFVAKPGVPNMFGLVGGEANSIEPGKRPVSSMTPTIITQNGKLFMVVGAPGGSRITTGVAQVVLDVLDFHMNPQDAVDLPRFHMQWRPDVLFLQNGFNQAARDELSKMGYQIKSIDGVARVEAIVMNHGVLEGGTESRLDGKAAGY